MTSAQLEIHPLDESSAETEAPFALREQVAERLAAHRARRTRPSATPVTPLSAPAPAKARAARIAATVAERYAQSQSYRAFLAAEAERAIREAEAAAEVAALSARAVAEAQNQLLFELDQTLNQEPDQTSAETATTPAPPAAASTEAPYGGLTVRMYEEVERGTAFAAAHPVYEQPIVDEDEAYALDEEIAFRQAPVFDEPPTDIPANLLQFPRQLVAPRKARPRLAEGPLREEADHTPDAAQLRIFEVEASQISTAPAVESAVPEWASIVLSALPATTTVETAEASYAQPLLPQTAPLGLRLMAGVVDSCLVLAAELGFITVSALTIDRFGAPATHLSPQAAIIGAAGIFVLFTLLYQTLFFTFSESTPGMRYARIGLCTLSDDNPTRSAMRRRILASILAACPLGLGFLWACLDEDALGWHDRISRMYQRSY